MSFESAIKDQAAGLGFDCVGITSADPPAGFAHFRGWLDKGYAGTMHYLARHASLRAAPSGLMPDVRSVVVVGALYRTPGAVPAADRLTGRVSCHAWGDDYHEWMRERLRRLLAFVQSQRPCQGRVCVDTAPVLERDLAQRAGLGWIGKNTMLIHRELGSYLFLGELLLSIPLEPDPPARSRCGTCTRCVDACPTGALVADHQLDARRCLSYLTIELKGAIPTAQRGDLGEWVYGCDLCQEACPWNRHAPASGHSAFEARSGLAPPDLIELLRLSADQYRSAFRGSAMRRAKRAGLMRNVAVVLGNRGDVRAVPALALALRDPEPLVRRHAAWALGRIGGPAARRALENLRRGETDPDVLNEVDGALGDPP